MLKIGLAGGSGSGKAVVSSLFSLNGIPAFDCDAVYHELISQNGTLTNELVAAFGEGVRSPRGGIDRRALFDAAFCDQAKRELLNAVSHRRILSVCREWIGRAERDGFSAVLIDAPLLYESGFDRECDLTIAVTAPEEVRLERIVRRDGISREEAERRIAAQIPDEELAKRADYVIRNGADLPDVFFQVKNILSLINERRNEP